MSKISYARHHFPPSMIQYTVWSYLRFCLGLRDVEDLLAERGVDLSHQTVRRCVATFGPLCAGRLRHRRPRPDDRWHGDEMFVWIDGRRIFSWRAVDADGEVLDVLVQAGCDTRAALKLMRKLLKRQGFFPRQL